MNDIQIFENNHNDENFYLYQNKFQKRKSNKEFNHIID